MFSHLVRVVAGAALVLAACVVPALAQQIIAVTEFTTNLSDAEVEAMSGPSATASGITGGLSDTMLTDLVQLLDEPEFSKCGVHVVEWTRIDEVQKEREFSKSKYVDPATVGEGEIMQANRFVRGHVSADGDGVAWLVEVEGPTGRLAMVEGRGKLTELIDGSTDIARQLLEKLCKPQAVRISAGMNDLELDGVVCDITQPFSVNGVGQAAGIRFDLVPDTAEGGAFTVTGEAAGVTWSGAGNYTIQDVEGQGAIFFEGAWELHSPMGTFGTSDTIPGTVTPLPDGCPS
jgi:hypothetical protein